MADTLAGAVRAGDAATVDRICRGPLVVRRDNLVERPWGGARLRQRLDPPVDGPPVGEAFEIAAFAGDREASAHPSIVRFPDGSELPLPDVLAAAGPRILGDDVYAAHGPNLPLLPKTLHICELLSVQAHPPGQPEAYVVLDAAPGATLRLGFFEDVDPRALAPRLEEGRREQALLRDAVRVDEVGLRDALRPFFVPVESTPSADEVLSPILREGEDLQQQAARLHRLRGLYGFVLDLLNDVPVSAGDVLFNAVAGRDDPARLDAAVHALGNPYGRDMLVLEVRRPGTTLRAWDHVRFPMRPVAVTDALQAMETRATSPDSYRRTPGQVAPGLWRSVDCPYFVVEHNPRRRSGGAAIRWRSPHPARRWRQRCPGHRRGHGHTGAPSRRLVGPDPGDPRCLCAAAGDPEGRGGTGYCPRRCVERPVIKCRS